MLRLRGTPASGSDPASSGGVALSVGRIILLVFGAILLLGAVASLFGGGALLWVNSALTDSEGFFTTSTIDLDKDSHAIVIAPANIDVRAAWLLERSTLATFKIKGSNDNSSKQIFIGIAEASDLNPYLSDVEYDEITDFSIYPYEVTYTNHPGDSEPAAPTLQTFWTASAYGDGNQTLEWEIKTGSYAMVLMNADGSADVDLSVVVGAKVPLIFGLGLGLLIGGVFALIIGIVMVFFAFIVLRPQTSPTTHPINEA